MYEHMSGKHAIIKLSKASLSNVINVRYHHVAENPLILNCDVVGANEAGIWVKAIQEVTTVSGDFGQLTKFKFSFFIPWSMIEVIDFVDEIRRVH